MKKRNTHSLSFATKTLILVAVLFFETQTTKAQIITTVAGHGSSTYSGDGGLAINAGTTPFGVCVDKSGNIYIADFHNRIRKVTVSTGIITTIAGDSIQGYFGDGGPATSASLFDPNGVCVDTSGNVYIADDGNNRIRKVTVSTGIITTIAGGGTFGLGDGGPATSAVLEAPVGVCVDASGNIYIADNYGWIRKVTVSTGIITTIAGNGSQGYSGDSGLAIHAELQDPTGVCVDTSGNVYIADSYNNRIRKITVSTGIITTVAGNGIPWSSGDGGPATSAELYRPTGVYVDAPGNIYIADRYNNEIRKVTVSTGIITTIAGNGTSGYSGDGGLATNAKLSGPIGVCVDTSGNVYIADWSNGRIRKVSNCPITTYSELHSDTIHSGALMSNIFVVVHIDTVSNNIITNIDSMLISIHLDTTKIIKDSVVFITQCTSVDSTIYADTISISTTMFDTIVHESSDTVACAVTIHNQVIADTTRSNALVLMDTVIVTHVDTVASKIITMTDSMFVSIYSHTARIIKDSIAFSVNQCTNVTDSVIYADTAFAVYAVTRDTLTHESSDTAICQTFVATQVMEDTSYLNLLVSVDTIIVVQTDTIGAAMEVITTTDSIFISTFGNITKIVKDSVVTMTNQCDTSVIVMTYSDTAVNSITSYDTTTHQSSDTTLLLNTGLENLGLSLAIRVYPNPFAGELNVDVGGEVSTIVLTDALGRMIMQTKDAGHVILQPNVLSGIYFLRVTDKNKSSTTIKVIAER